jgi:GINS complex subunit 3
MANMLTRLQVTTIDTPKAFTNTFLQNLQAQPIVINLYSKCYYFYEIGIKLISTIGKGIGEVLFQSLSERYKEITKRSDWQIADPTSFTSFLASSERKIFASKYESMQQFELWKTRRSHKISSVLVASHNNNNGSSSSSSSGSGGGSSSKRRKF